MELKQGVKRLGVIGGSMQAILGLLFLLYGIEGMIEFGSPSSELGRLLSRTFGNVSGLVEFIIALVELLSGSALIAALFTPLVKSFRRWAVWSILIVWILVMFILDIVAPNFGASNFAWISWGQQLLIHGLILLGVMSITR